MLKTPQGIKSQKLEKFRSWMGEYLKNCVLIAFRQINSRSIFNSVEINFEYCIIFNLVFKGGR